VLLLGINPKEKADPEFFKTLVAKGPRIDLVITDEPSIKKPFRVNRTWIAAAGLDMAAAARFTLDLDPATGRMTGLDWDRLPLLAAKYGEDLHMLDVIAGYRKAAAAHFAKKVGFLTAPLPLRENGVSPAADFAADCMKRWARTNAAVLSLSEPAAGFSSGTVRCTRPSRWTPASFSLRSAATTWKRPWARCSPERSAFPGSSFSSRTACWKGRRATAARWSLPASTTWRCRTPS